MSRSIKKGPFIAPELLKRVEELNAKNEKKVLKTWSRASTIFPSFVAITFLLFLHNLFDILRCYSATSQKELCQFHQ